MAAVVLDTNVLVSALIKPASIPEFVFQLALEHPDIQLCFSTDIYAEYEAVLAYAKFASRIRDRYKREALSAITDMGRRVSVKNTAHPTLTDPSDEKFLACAIAAHADFLITGNVKHFPKTFRYVSVVTPRAFLDAITDSLPAAA